MQELVGSFFNRHAVTLWLAPHRAPTARKQLVSDSVSLPFRGSFHLSLAVLVHYRSPEYLALPHGRGSFPQGFSCPVVLRNRPGVLRISPTGLSPAVAPLSRGFDYRELLCLPSPCATGDGRSSNPTAATPARSALHWFRLFRVRSPLLTESLVLSSLRGTEMFHFPRFPLLPYGFRQESPTCVGGVAPFGHPRITV